ncbi:DUF2079 domain-containing protein [Kocuria salsicia]|uniref:DUF2079 domain-containing protein n=1 Tax=Kocuria salsicia TaxID=664639 RepID=UPI0011A0C041|nr:DUF2079 domain-containing protein [Kocuria salsicia]
MTPQRTSPLQPTGSARWLPVLVGVLATALYCALSWSQWINWEVPSWDNAIFTQLLSSYASGRGPEVDLKGHGFNLLGDHFHPLLIVLAPVYKLFPSALTLMLVQDVLFGIATAVVTRCATRVLRAAPAAAVGAACALSFGLQNAVAVQFHEIALAVPLLALSLSAWREGRLRATALWAAPLALVKEDLGITVAVIGTLLVGRAVLPFARRWAPEARRRLAGLTAALRQPEAAVPGGPGTPGTPGTTGTTGPAETLGRTGGSVENRGSGVVVLDRAQWRSDLRGLRRDPVLLWGAVLAVWGMGVSALAVGVVLPALNPAGEFAYADKLDPAGFLRDPASAVILLVVPVRKLVTWLLVLLSGAVVAVRSPVLLVALPTLLWRMLSPNDGYWGPGWHYSAVLMPVVFVALVDAVARLRGDADRARRRTGGTAPTSPSARFEAPVLTVLAAGAPWAALVIALVVGTVQPLAQLVTPAAWQPDPRGDVKAAAVAEIPEGASVATDLSLMNALVSRTRVHWIGNGEDPAPEYVVVDRSGGTWGTTPPQDVAGYAQDVYGHRYTVVSDEANIVVARESS